MTGTSYTSLKATKKDTVSFKAGWNWVDACCRTCIITWEWNHKLQPCWRGHGCGRVALLGVVCGSVHYGYLVLYWFCDGISFNEWHVHLQTKIWSANRARCKWSAIVDWGCVYSKKLRLLRQARTLCTLYVHKALNSSNLAQSNPRLETKRFSCKQTPSIVYIWRPERN